MPLNYDASKVGEEGMKVLSFEEDGKEYWTKECWNLCMLLMATGVRSLATEDNIREVEFRCNLWFGALGPGEGKELYNGGLARFKGFSTNVDEVSFPEFARKVYVAAMGMDPWLRQRNSRAFRTWASWELNDAWEEPMEDEE